MKIPRPGKGQTDAERIASIDRRQFLSLFNAGVAASVLPTFGSAQQVRNRPPNIILIMADDLGYGDLSCYGAMKIATPHCDGIVEKGMRFTDAHSPAGVCTPTRYGAMTGRYGWRTWLKNLVINDRMPLLINQDRLTVGKMLQKCGYVTGCVGKWHLGWGKKRDAYQNGVMEPGPLECGFDFFFGVPFSHNSPPSSEVFVRNRTIVGIKDGESIMDPDVQKRCRRRLADTAINLSKEAVAFIEDNKAKPFFLYYPTTNVHAPVTPNERFRKKSQMGAYGDYVVEFDWVVGQVLEALDRLGLAEDTLLFVTSDNGSSNRKDSNDPWRGRKAEIYEGGHRVPFIARWPGNIESGSTCSETVCLTDLMATIAELLNFRLGNDAAEDSESFLPALYGNALRRQRQALVHHSASGMFAIRQGKWKLIEGLGNGYTKFDIDLDDKEAYQLPRIDDTTGEIHDLSFKPKPFPKAKPGQPEGQLYDLEADPKETRNVYGENSEIVASLKALLDHYRKAGRSVVRA